VKLVSTCVPPDFSTLQRCLRCGLRNGRWRRLRVVEKAFYRASMWYAKAGGRIVNEKVVGMLLEIFEKLRASFGARANQAGLQRAEELASTYSAREVFSWCPRLRVWLKEQGYILYLGVSWMNTSTMFKQPA